MWNLSAPQWGRIFLGEIQQESSNTPYRPRPEDMERWRAYLSMSVTAQTVLDATESERNFFKIERDLALIVPRKEWSEFFYSLKNGFVAPNCPAKFIYFAKAIYDQYQICNLIGPLLPKELATCVRRENYFGAGYTARDAICNFVNANFQPITDERPIVRCGDWYEAYIPQADMVIALPLDIGRLLTAEDLQEIKLVPGRGPSLGGRALSTFCDHQGVTKNLYDLRGVI